MTKWRSIIFIMGVLFFAVSCTQKTSKHEVSGKPIKVAEPVQLNWVGHWQNEGYKEQLLYDMARRFEFENQDVVINIKFPKDAYGGKNEAEYIIEELKKPASTWDIFRINNEVNGIANIINNPEWPAEYLVDFSQFEQFRNNSQDVVTSEKMKKRWGGIVPGHALDAHSFVLWCNKDVAAKLGIEIKQFDITVDDFELYLKKVNEYNKTNNKTIYGFTFNSGWLPTYSLGLQLFCSIIGDYNKIIDENYSEEKVKAWEQVLKYLENLTQYKPIDPNWKNIPYESDYKNILNDECLFVINGTWMYNIWQGLDSINYKKVIPLELPAFNPSKTYLGEVSIPWVVPKNSVHKEEAIRFMLYWCQPEVADEWVRNTKSPSGIKGSLVQSEFGFDYYETFDYTINKKYSGTKIPLNYGNSTFMFGVKNAWIPNYFMEVVSGDMTADAAIRAIRSRLVKR